MCDIARSDSVVVVDNDPDACRLLSRLLSKQGLHSVVCSNVEDGIKAARQHRPRAITLDVLMSGTNGWAMLERLKADPVLEDIPVVMVTVVDDQKRGFELGASAYLTKPLDAEAFHEAIRRCVAREAAGHSV